MSDIQTPPVGTEQDPVIPQIDPELETPEIPETPGEVPPETPAPETTPPEPTPPDYKQKFVESSREGILNHERAQVANSRIEQLTKQDTPTDEAMRSLYSNWDELDPVSKNFYVKQEAQEMRQRRIEVQQQDIVARQQLEDKLEDFLDSPPEDFKKIIGKEAEFTRFAKRKNNIGLSLETLAKAFLFDASDGTPQPTTGEALPAGSGGPRDPLKPKKISIEEAAEIRKTDSKRWLELVKAGAIEELE